MKAARDDNDRTLAAEIGKLRKPTTSGVVGQSHLARCTRGSGCTSRALANRYATLNAISRARTWRRLTTQRQQVVRSLAHKSGEIAASRGKSVGEDSLRDVAQTLNAALADEETAGQVRLGRVVTAASYSGFRAGGTCCSGGGFCTRRPCDPHRRTRSGQVHCSGSQGRTSQGESRIEGSQGRRREDPTTGSRPRPPSSRMPGQSCPTSTVASQNSAPISNTQNKNDSSPRTPRRLPASRFESPRRNFARPSGGSTKQKRPSTRRNELYVRSS